MSIPLLARRHSRSSSANIPKIPTGGWFPLLVGFVLRRPDDHVASRPPTRRRTASAVAERPIEAVVDEAIAERRRPRRRARAVYMFKDAGWRRRR